MSLLRRDRLNICSKHVNSIFLSPALPVSVTAILSALLVSFLSFLFLSLLMLSLTQGPKVVFLANCERAYMDEPKLTQS